MAATTGETERVDGRVARRERNRDAVLDVVLAMFADDMVFPTIEQASARSGLSLRSLYRYFADPGELVEAAIVRRREQVAAEARLPHIGSGPFDDRLVDFVAMRVRLYESSGPMFRATLHNAAMHPRIREELQTARRLLREQFELQFEPELAALNGPHRVAALEAGNVLTQLDSIDQLRRSEHLSVAEAEAVLSDSLIALLARPA